jgi:hypothetical protein
MATSTSPTKAWTRLLGTSSGDWANALTTGSDGAIYMAGLTQGSLDGQTDSGVADAFLTKYNPDGSKAWTRLLGTSSGDWAYALTTGTDGAIYMAGLTSGSLGGQTYSGDYSDAFLTKYDANGNKAWTRLLGSISRDWAEDLTTGSDGAIYMAGYTQGSLDGQTFSGVADAFLTKYDVNGNKAWTRLLGTSSDDWAFALTTGTDGAIYMAGKTQGNLDGQKNSGEYDAFIAKYDLNGSKVWTRLLGTSSDDEAYALTTGTDGAIYMAGYTQGSLDGQTFSGVADAFLTKYDVNGNKAWTRLLGTNSGDYALALTTGTDGAIYVTGRTGGSLDGQTHSGSFDAFLTKYDANGTKAWTRLLETSTWDEAYTLTTGADGAIYMAGYTQGSLDGQTFSGVVDAFVTKWIVNAALPTVHFSIIGSSANEGNSGSTTVTVQATLSAISAQTVTVPVTYSGTATSGTDYTNATTSITIPAGQTTGTATFSVVGDTTPELDETVILTMGTPTNATLGTNKVYTHTVLNDDLDQQVVSRTNALTVLVDKGVLGPFPFFLKDLVEEITTTGTTVTSHTVSYQGTKFKYGDIDALITTVIRDGEFTEEFRKEITELAPSLSDISYQEVVSLVGAANVDSILIYVAGADGNYVG